MVWFCRYNIYSAYYYTSWELGDVTNCLLLISHRALYLWPVFWNILLYVYLNLITLHAKYMVLCVLFPSSPSKPLLNVFRSCILAPIFSPFLFFVLLLIFYHIFCYSFFSLSWHLPLWFLILSSAVTSVLSFTWLPLVFIRHSCLCCL